ncbi:MAG: TIGR03013 family XrtA/PEP-CTERM system glycosyltransferase [Pseudomonadota bacterium]
MPFLSFAIEGRRAAFFALEVALIAFVFWIAHQALGYDLWTETSFDGFLRQAILPTALVVAAIIAFGGYQPDTQDQPGEMVQRVSLGVLCGGVAVLAISIIFFGDNRPATPLIAGLAGSTAGLVGLRLGLSRVHIDTFQTNILVLGAGTRSAKLLSTLSDAAKSRIVGLAPCKSDREEGAAAGFNILRAEGDESFADMVRRRKVSEIIVALDDRRGGSFPMRELIDCRMRGVGVTDANTFIERETGKVDLDNLYPSWLVFSPGFKAGRVRDALKRVIDLFFSIALLAFFFPLLVGTAILIKLESPGPVFYLQTRVGQNGIPFRLVKFRSMRSDAEKDGAVWARKNDARVTRVGKVIRKIRIDEIPQAINVLRGEMSFVGPRPERPEFVQMLADEIDYYDERHRVKPGITGWAQVNYPYGASVEDAREKLKYDLFYMKNYSGVFDLSIILQTIRVMLFALGGR